MKPEETNQTTSGSLRGSLGVGTSSTDQMKSTFLCLLGLHGTVTSDSQQLPPIQIQSAKVTIQAYPSRLALHLCQRYSISRLAAASTIPKRLAQSSKSKRVLDSLELCWSDRRFLRGELYGIKTFLTEVPKCLRSQTESADVGRLESFSAAIEVSAQWEIGTWQNQLNRRISPF